MPRYRVFSLTILLVLFCLCNVAGAQSWSGLLAPNRAVDWSNAGAGTIPARTTICTTLGLGGQASNYAQSVTAGQIVSALQGCASGQTVLLNPGTYHIGSTLFGGGVATPSNVTLRGSGPTQTILEWTGTSNNCNGLGATAFCIYNGDAGTLNYSANTVNVSGGTSQGSTSLTMGSAVNGSLSNLQVGALVALTATDQGSDNGNWWACGTTGSSGSCSQQGVANAWSGRTTTQIATVTSISGSTVGITPGIYAPNWGSGHTVYASFSSSLPVTAFGLENLTVNTQSVGDIQAMVESMWAKDSWIKNVSFINNDGVGNDAARKHAEISSSAHFTVRDSYLFGSSPSSEGYGIDFILGTSDSLAENNICQHLASCTILETATGNVFGYNYAVDNFYTGNGTAPNWQQCDAATNHDAGDFYNLWEGHDGICASADDLHGTAFAQTVFRSYFNGRDQATQCPGGGNACGTQTKNQDTFAIGFEAFNRYYNLVANVLGTSGYHSNYQIAGVAGDSTCGFGWNYVYQLNFSFGGGPGQFSPGCSGSGFVINNDSMVSSTLVRWGNYDTVNGSVQTNSSETASNASTYPGLTSPSTSWSSYPSFYLSSKPSWWGPMPWPAVGPDVTGGDIASVGGHAYHNPAANCYLNVLGGKTDGSSGVLAFDASACYPTGASSNGGAPPPPTGLTGTVQ